LYRCAIGYGGIYDLKLLYRHRNIRRRDWGLDYRVRERGAETKQRARYSPVARAGDITVPVLIVHGTRDGRSPVWRVKNLLKYLSAAGHPAERLIVAGEGHRFHDEKNRLAMYHRLLAFLNRHIGRAAAPVANEAPASRP